MHYHRLTPEQMANIHEHKLLELEAEHAALTLDVRLAGVVGLDNESVAQARLHLNILEAQHAALAAWSERPPMSIEPTEDAPACPPS